MTSAQIGIIGGSGIQEMEGLLDVEKVEMDTPFGRPSAPYVIGTIEGRRAAFLARHGIGHVFMPTEIPYRANIYGFKKLGVERIISCGAVGSMKETIKPLDFVIPDQFLDRTTRRQASFFGDGIVGHISFAEPVCPDLSKALVETGRSLGLTTHPKGTYLCMEGPAFSSLAESMLYRQWGVDVIGMTNLTEAKLAREAEICYSTIALVTDYDCWHEEEENVTVETIVAYLMKNAENAKKLIRHAMSRIGPERACHCTSALKGAIFTAPDKMNPRTKENLRLLIDKHVQY
ncbi:MAG: S-methyl-5'-thioadenosine phosphorylase [Acidobacteriota bacterium]